MASSVKTTSKKKVRKKHLSEKTKLKLKSAKKRLLEAKKKAAKFLADFPPFDYANLNPSPVIGVDEVGRGCLAGRVYAAAVILPEGFIHDGITDSKLISEERRLTIASEIRQAARVSVAFAEVEEIDELNILKASLLAMKRAIEGLGVESGTVLVDGNQKIPHLPEAFKQITIIKGDLRAKPIGAASIVAKVERDQEMCRLAQLYPHYGFEKHKGYASETHRLAIQKFGPSAIHRKTFSSVKEFNLEVECEVGELVAVSPPTGTAI